MIDIFEKMKNKIDLHIQKINQKQKYKMSEIMQKNKDQGEVQDLQPAKHFEQMSDLPIKRQDRVLTDKICIFIFAGFVGLLLLLSFFLFNNDKYVKSSIPTDSDGKLCGHDHEAYPYLYFVNLPDVSSRVCVKECPQPTDRKLKCVGTKNIACGFSNTPGFIVRFYPNHPEQNRLGKFCMPEDQQVKNDILNKTNLTDKYIVLNSIDRMTISGIITLISSIIYIGMVQCIPRVMNKIAIYFGTFSLALLALVIAMYPTSNLIGKIIVCLVLITLCVLLFIYIRKNTEQFEIHGVFLQSASLMFNTEQYLSFANSFIFACLELLFMLVIIFQFRAFWLTGTLVFKPEESLLWEFDNVAASWFFTFLLMIKLVWGFTFLKQSFNYLMSGYCISWYYQNCWPIYQPFITLFTKHIGSVIGGAFLNGMLTVLDYAVDMIKPTQNDQSEFREVFERRCGGLVRLLELVRSDSMAFINLTGNPYCNSARYCAYLCQRSILMKESQSCSRTYRICSHFLIVSITGIYAFQSPPEEISPYVLFFILIIALFICTFFVSLHADSAEAICILFLLNEEISKRLNEFNIDGWDREDQGIFDSLPFQNQRIHLALTDVLARQEQQKQQEKPEEEDNTQ